MNSDEIDDLIARFSEAAYKARAHAVVDGGGDVTLEIREALDISDALHQLQADNQRLLAENEALRAVLQRYRDADARRRAEDFAGGGGIC